MTRKRWWMLSGAALLVGVVLAALFWPVDDDVPDYVTHPAFGPTPTLGVPLAERTTAPPTPTVAPTSAAATATTTPFTIPTHPVVATVAAPPGALDLSTRSIGLGRSATSSSLRLTNTGGQTITFSLTPSAGRLHATPATHLIAPGKSVLVTVSADRGQTPEGEQSAAVVVVSDRGTQSVAVSIDSEHPPTVSRPRLGARSGCAVLVTATAVDEHQVARAMLVWSGKGGSGRLPMTLTDGVWTASATNRVAGGAVSYRVTATDVRGNTGTSPTLSAAAPACSPA